MSYSAKPIKCSAIMPHRTNTDEVLFKELDGTIASIYHTVNTYSPKYSLEDATSDAWIGFTKAKEHDNKPPSIADTTICCPECDNEMEMPEVMESDLTADPSSDRTFDLECDHCHYKWQKHIKKAQFSTCVFHYIRGEIQRGARESRRCGIQKIKKQVINGHRIDPSVVSVDVFDQTSDKVCNAISIEHNMGDSGISIEMRNRIQKAVAGLPARQREVISRMFGFQYNGETMDAMTQAQVADFAGITRQRICAIVKKANENLKIELGKHYEA